MLAMVEVQTEEDVRPQRSHAKRGTTWPTCDGNSYGGPDPGPTWFKPSCEHRSRGADTDSGTLDKDGRFWCCVQATAPPFIIDSITRTLVTPRKITVKKTLSSNPGPSQ